MAGTRHGTGPALTADGRSKKAKWLRRAALILLIAATPFSWLIVRDTILILRASDGPGASLARGNLVDRFNQTIRDSVISLNSRKPLPLTIVLDSSCFELEAGKLRPSDTPAAQSSFEDGRPPSLNAILSSHRFLAERMVDQVTEGKAVSDSFSTSELIFFNACMAATPFASACETRVAARRDAAYNKAFAETTRILGVQARRAGAPEQYCYTMPDLVDRPIP